MRCSRCCAQLSAPKPALFSYPPSNLDLAPASFLPARLKLGPALTDLESLMISSRKNVCPPLALQGLCPRAASLAQL